VRAHKLLFFLGSGALNLQGKDATAEKDENANRKAKRLRSGKPCRIEWVRLSCPGGVSISDSQRLPTVLLNIVHGYADDAVERAWTAALTPCSVRENVHVTPAFDHDHDRKDTWTSVGMAAFQHYNCFWKTKRGILSMAAGFQHHNYFWKT